jgi:hypothetical protein
MSYNATMKNCEIHPYKLGDVWKVRVTLYGKVHPVRGEFNSEAKAFAAGEEYCAKMLAAPAVPPSRPQHSSELNCKRCAAINRVHYNDAASILNETPLGGIDGLMESQVYCCACDPERKYAIGTVRGVPIYQEYRKPDETDWYMCV